MTTEPRIDLHRLSAEEIVYVVYRDGALIHLGESESIARAGQYVQGVKRDRNGTVTAQYIEVTEPLRTVFAMPTSVPSTCLFRGNLERLLQAAYFARYGCLPLNDRVRGGKGTSPTATGGFVRGVDVLPAVFALLDRLHPPKDCVEPWPTIDVAPPESIEPVIQVGAGRPGTRQRHLAFWADIRDRECVIGHVPDLNGAPQYGATSRSVVWRQGVPELGARPPKQSLQ